jgi:hypothetical protein
MTPVTYGILDKPAWDPYSTKRVRKQTQRLNNTFQSHVMLSELTRYVDRADAVVNKLKCLGPIHMTLLIPEGLTRSQLLDHQTQ